MKKPQHELRCVNCNKLLFKHNLRDGLIEVKCPDTRCKAFTRVEIDQSNKSVSIEERIEVFEG